jgi:hypothetical protein
MLGRELASGELVCHRDDNPPITSHGGVSGLPGLAGPAVGLRSSSPRPGGAVAGSPPRAGAPAWGLGGPPVPFRGGGRLSGPGRTVPRPRWGSQGPGEQRCGASRACAGAPVGSPGGLDRPGRPGAAPAHAPAHARGGNRLTGAAKLTGSRWAREGATILVCNRLTQTCACCSGTME